MKKTLRNLLLASTLLFAISFDCFTFGIAYDQKHRLSPETEYSYCTFSSDEVYGRRWGRLGLATIFMGTALGFSAILMWSAEKERRKGVKIMLN